MKKLLLILSFAFLATSLCAEEKLLFDLNAQYFSKTKKVLGNKYQREGLTAKYDLSLAYAIVDRNYEQQGNIAIELKDKPQNWRINIRFKQASSEHISLVSDTGKGHTIFVYDSVIEVNEKKYEIGDRALDEKMVMIEISSINNTTLVKINSTKFLEINEDFGKLKILDVKSRTADGNNVQELKDIQIFKL